jgi:hypothetical protein
LTFLIISVESIMAAVATSNAANAMSGKGP